MLISFIIVYEFFIFALLLLCTSILLLFKNAYLNHRNIIIDQIIIEIITLKSQNHFSLNKIK